jgi:hypothetical protein
MIYSRVTARREIGFGPGPRFSRARPDVCKPVAGAHDPASRHSASGGRTTAKVPSTDDREMTVRSTSLLVLALLLSASPAVADGEAFRRAVASAGHAILMRHAIAPGTGDPAELELGDCATQRNLDESGREQARRLGDRLRQLGVDDRPVYTSRWCRSRETARLLDIGPVEAHDGLNSFFGDRFTRQEVMPQLRAFLRDSALDPPPVLVTHQVVITALTGVFPREGEMIAIAVGDDGGVRVVARLRP